MTTNGKDHSMHMKAYIFLNGFYDSRYISFYKKQLDLADDETVLLCANGGIKIFEKINTQFNANFYPHLLLGDGDSVGFDHVLKCCDADYDWIRETKIINKNDQDRTDGEFAVSYAIEKYGCNSIIIFGGLNDARDYNTDHFLGNLKLMRFGFHIYQKKDNTEKSQYCAVMRDVFQDIHFVVDSITIETRRSRNYKEITGGDTRRQSERVSFWTDYSSTVVASSEHLKWSLRNFHIDPNAPNAMRNEFVPDAQTASITLRDDSDPVYLIHNW